ncbi:MAG: SPOR domain-containing protein [Steroidobacteraceae bacterium]|nr:SPOR domain-containing protein [Deltaproteobacteria bacterium]
MYRIIELISISNTLRLIVFFVVILSLHGCATTKIVHEEHQPIPRHLEEYVEQNEFSVAKRDDVIGRLRFISLEKGDTLPDIARHFGLGIKEVTAANPGVDIWVPKAGERIMLPLSFILPDAPRKGIVINLAAMRLFQFKGNGESLAVLTYPAGVGTEERPSPTGQMFVERKVSRPTWHVPSSIAEDHRKKGDPLPAKILPGPQNPLGEYALYLSKPSYLIHGTNKPASIGLRATNGCIRLYPENVKKLYENTPVKTPVYMVNQPYLLGQSNGAVYMEVHASPEDLDAAELDKIYAKLRNIEKKSGRALDWSKVKNVLAEARGIPVPIFEISQGSGKGVAEPMEVRHPGELFGRPEIPELKKDAWSVLAADLHDEIDAVRMAAIINHQGPPIPAKVVSKNVGYQVIAGPFNDIRDAKDAIKRLKIDLEIDGRLIERAAASPAAVRPKNENTPPDRAVKGPAKEKTKVSKTGGPGNPGGYALQIGVFAEEKNALSLAEKLKQQGYEASFHKDGKRPLLRVLIGGFDTSEKALEESRLILQKDGIESVIYRY